MGAIKPNGLYAAYLRKSRRDMEMEALGQGETLARHEKQLSDLADRLGIRVSRWYREIVSGDTIAERPQVRQLLEDCGVSTERAEVFEEKYDETFGAYAELPAVNLVTPKQFKVDTPSVSIRVDPERSDLIETRVIDGKCYILVLADGDVQVNGVNVKLNA